MSTTAPDAGQSPADGEGRTSGNNRVALPDGWLKDPYDCAGVSADAELDTSGG
nr:hypothetical protein [Streptomyces sp. FT05W]